ncbi:MAG: hypothetical protein D6722_09845 [Bacteroidetes bacterium]|nr:MAG: hypothetical protein D6722_09845 [Bacteroidota bacterium]
MKERFIHHLFANFGQYCTSRGLTPDTAHLLSYLIEQGVIYEEAMRHYVILYGYDSLRRSHTYKNKTQTIRALAAQLHLHENTIWNVLKDHRGKFGASPSRPHE